MADPLSVSSALIAIVTGTVQASIALYKTINSFKNHPRKVRQLMEELEALTAVLQSLQAVADRDATTLTCLTRPLEGCKRACVDFRKIMIKCSARSGGSTTSFRDWARLNYMQGDIDSFTNMLAGYKSTITIALGDANLRSTSITLQALNDYKTMINNTKTDLEDHLMVIEQKLESLSTKGGGDSTDDVLADLERIQAEKDSTEECIKIVTSISTQINRIRFQPVLEASSSTVGPAEAGLALRDLTWARVITSSTLKECSDKLVDTATRLQSHIATTSERLQDPEANPEVEAERLQAERDSVQQRLVFCDEASDRASSDRVHVVEDITTGDDGHQLLVSTVGDLFKVKGMVSGSRSFQFIGSTSDATLQKILEVAKQPHYNTK